MANSWHVLLEGNVQRGPLTEEQVREMIASGQVAGGNYCWTDGLANWVPLADVAAFASACGVSFPPASPPVSGQISEGWETIKGTFDRGKRTALRTLKSAKLRMDLSSLRKNREKLCAALGAAVYMQQKDSTVSDSIKGLLDPIAQCDAEIADTERRIAEIESSG